jgi:hypothetical protein
VNHRYLAAGSLLLFLLLLTLGVVVDSRNADAIPAFARKYRMSCTTCHNPIPRLKAYGDDFAGNGFVLADQDAPRFFVDTGDDDLSLIRDFPVAVRLDAYLKYESEGNRNFDLGTPYALKLMSGGSLADHLAYYFYFYMSERGEVAGVEDAYLMFNDLLGYDLDLYVGQFQISDPLFKRELRLTYEDYAVYTYQVGRSQFSLKYDRGLMLTLGLESGTDVIFELVNGNGLEAADESHLFDDDKYKSFVGRVSQDIGENFRLGLFGYWGEEGHGNTNEVLIAGPDMTLTDGKYLELNFQYLERRDSNPLFDDDEPDDNVDSRGAMAELIFMPEGDQSKWYAVGLVNWTETDESQFDEAELRDQLGSKYLTASGQVGYLLRTNLRLIAEFTYDAELEEFRQVVGFVSAF